MTRPDPPQYFEAIYSRQTDVQYYQIKRRLERAIHRGLTIVNRNWRMTGLG